MRKKAIASFVIAILSTIAFAILLPILSFPYTEKMKDPDASGMFVFLISLGFLLLGIFVLPISFII